jgi:PPOX class probable F420-dependent enzyme
MSADLRADALACRLLDAPNMAHVATLLRDGSPHVVPVWVARDGDRVLFVKEEGTLGLKNLQRDPRVAISLVDRDNAYILAYLRGRAEVQRGPVASEWLHLISRKYTGSDYPSPEPPVALVVVEPERASGHRIEEFA